MAASEKTALLLPFLLLGRRSSSSLRATADGETLSRALSRGLLPFCHLYYKWKYYAALSLFARSLIVFWRAEAKPFGLVRRARSLDDSSFPRLSLTAAEEKTTRRKREVSFHARNYRLFTCQTFYFL